MLIMAGHFYATLPSNSSFDYFPNNTLTGYTTKLAEPITLKGQWEVGLCEIQYPFTWHNVTKSNCALRVNDREICIPVGYYDHISDVIEAIYRQFEEDDLQKVKIVFQNTSRKIIVKLKEDTTLSFGSLSHMFGFLTTTQFVLTP